MTVPVQPIEVLLIEDDAGDELMTREAFEDNKIDNRLHVVRDGEEALDFLYRRGGYADAPRVDLILLDLNLPKYDGRSGRSTTSSCPWCGCRGTDQPLRFVRQPVFSHQRRGPRSPHRELARGTAG
jgi:hypothetical protein